MEASADSTTAASATSSSLPRLTYFDLKGIAEPIRLALYIGGIHFEDERLKWEEFVPMKPSLPFGQVPVFAVEGEVLSQSVAILTHAGRWAKLFPEEDLLQTAKCLEVLLAMNELKAVVSGATHQKDPSVRKRETAEVASTHIPRIFAGLEKIAKANGGNGFMVGKQLTVADLQVYVLASWMNSGVNEDLPTNLFDDKPSLLKVVKTTGMHPKVMEWNARTRRGSTVSN